MNGLQVHAIDGSMIVTHDGPGKLVSIRKAAGDGTCVFAIAPIRDGALGLSPLLEAAQGPRRASMGHDGEPDQLLEYACRDDHPCRTTPLRVAEDQGRLRRGRGYPARHLACRRYLAGIGEVPRYPGGGMGGNPF